MLCNLNEKYLLKFISDSNYNENGKDNLVKVLKFYGAKIKFRGNDSVWDIIDLLEFDKVFYE